MAFLADGDVAHRRVGANRSRPADGDDIVVFLAVATSDHHGGQGINQGSGFEGDFHRIYFFVFYPNNPLGIPCSEAIFENSS